MKRENKMKMNKISLKNPWMGAAMFVLATVSLSSCLKNTGPVEDFGQSPALVGFQYKGSQSTPMVASLPVGTSDTVGLEVTLSVASLTLKSPVVVTLALDPDSLDRYNQANIIADSTCQCYVPYTMLDPSTYTLPANNQVTIAPGQQIADFNIVINPSLIDFVNTNPMLVFKITNATGASVASNLSVVLMPIKLKNPYQGSYTVTGYFNHPAAPRYENLTKNVATISPVRSESTVGDLGALFQWDVSPTNTLVNFVNSDGSLAPPFVEICCTDNAHNNANFPGPPYTYTTYNNTYDPVAFTFWMHYGYNGNPSSREIYEQWVLQP
jgi:hypothetical protein